MGGRGQGHRRMKKRAEEVGQGQFQWGPHPQGESSTFYADIPAAAEKPGVFSRLSCQFLEAALLKGICWAQF